MSGFSMRRLSRSTHCVPHGRILACRSSSDQGRDPWRDVAHTKKQISFEKRPIFFLGVEKTHDSRPHPVTGCAPKNLKRSWMIAAMLSTRTIGRPTHPSDGSSPKVNKALTHSVSSFTGRHVAKLRLLKKRLQPLYPHPSPVCPQLLQRHACHAHSAPPWDKQGEPFGHRLQNAP